MSAAVHADTFEYGIGAESQSLRTIAGRSENSTPVIVCGGQTGDGASLRISGANIAAVWRMTYYMLFPRANLADQPKPEPIVPRHDKSLTWDVGVTHGKALLSIQTKW